MKNRDHDEHQLDLARRPEPPRPSSIAVWRPDIVLAECLTAPAGPARIVVADPRLRPEAVRARLEVSRSVLAAAAEAGHTLGARVAAAEARALAASDDRERVVAVMEAYRATSALETVLGGTILQVRALLEERGTR